MNVVVLVYNIRFSTTYFRGVRTVCTVTPQSCLFCSFIILEGTIWPSRFNRFPLGIADRREGALQWQLSYSTRLQTPSVSVHRCRIKLLKPLEQVHCTVTINNRRNANQSKSGPKTWGVDYPDSCKKIPHTISWSLRWVNHWGCPWSHQDEPTWRYFARSR